MSHGMHGFRLRLKALFHKQRMDRDMAEELAFHQTMMREKMLREGVPPGAAEAATRRSFGSEARWHERLRELWQFRSFEQLKRDVVFSLRLLRKSPVFTTVAVLTLALGIGANMAIFSMINALLLRPLPVPHSDELAVIRIDAGPRDEGPQYSLASPFFRSLERRHDVFQQVFAFSRYPFNVRMHGGIEAMPGQMVGGEYFSGLEVRPVLGRALTPQDDTPGAPVQALVLSYDTWQQRFGGNPAVLGQTLEVSKLMFTIVGVMPKGFYGADPTDRPAFFIPLATEPLFNPENSMTKAGYHGWWLSVMGRRQPNVTLQQASAALQTETEPILREGVPDAGWIKQSLKDHFQFNAEAGNRGFTYMRLQFANPLYVVFAMCGGILLLACLNLASLLLARGASRERELATRLALGAARIRLVQQMLIESLLLGIAGTTIGLAFAPLVSHSLSAILLANNSIAAPHLDTSLDLRVFAFAVLLVAVLTLLTGLLPALRATGGSVNEHLKEGQHASRDYTRRALLPKMLMASEVGLALILLIGAGLLAASLVRLYRSGIGYDPKGLELLSFNMETEKLHGDALARRYQEIGEGLSRQPGVRSVSFVLISPFMGMSWDQGFTPQGEKTEKDIWMNVVAPGYFSTSGIAMLTGHDFSASDSASSSLKAVINQEAAKLLFPNRNPIGLHITRKDAHSDKMLAYEVIAVVGNAKYNDVHAPAPATVYLTIAQNIDPFSSYNAMVRMADTKAPLGPLLAAARDVTRRVAPDIAAPTLTSLYQTVDNALATERVMVLLALYFAAVALLVTGIGLYGTLAYATARRTSEIGIRIALGAQRERVVALIFRENAMLALTGVAAGLLLALFAARVLTHLNFLFATSAHDPMVLALAVLALAIVAAAASLVPAVRAARINPIRAIRCE
ncbi:ADOP family duplicated permease [Silvibacterium sp.]|uniref:ADOP family duplicated permease n=1 Tax=Silvibacterium sp. TaxID=1964179 RepID=UPI0039E4D2F2